MADILQAVDRTGVRAFLRLLGWTAILAIAVLSLVPGELRPHTGTSHYFEHFTAYFLTAMVLTFAYRGRVAAVALFACLVIYAGALETGQLWIPGREARIADFATSSLGSLAGIAFATLIHWIMYQRTSRIG